MALKAGCKGGNDIGLGIGHSTIPMSEFYNSTIPCNTVLQGEKNTWRSGKGQRKSSLGLQTEEITHWRKEPFSTPICQKSSVSYFFCQVVTKNCMPLWNYYPKKSDQ